MDDLKTKFYQMFILGLDGGNYKTALKNGLGGVIFFTKDIETKNQFKDLINKIKSYSVITPFLSIDQEGGRVERSENIHNGKKYLSAKYAFEKGEDFLKTQTKQIAQELKSYGINLNFAPCIDVNTNPDNPIIGERAFSSNPSDVIWAEKIVSKVYRDYGIVPCVKHYPGHGDANADSHLTLPEIDLDIEKMKNFHIKPFEYAVKNGIQMIMAAHLYCKCFDDEKIPASLSKNAIGYLRNNLGYDGVIISDDMVMKGVADYGRVQACVMGIKAGLNMFIYRNSDDKTINMIEDVFKIICKDSDLCEKVESSYDKIMKIKSVL